MASRDLPNKGLRLACGLIRTIRLPARRVDLDQCDLLGCKQEPAGANGYSSSIKQFCFPKILVGHWLEVAPKMTPVRPFASYRYSGVPLRRPAQSRSKRTHPTSHRAP